jgi:hypothetical protein
MRRLMLTSAVLLALVVPATASALHAGPGDGWLVLRNGDNGDGIGSDARPYDARPVVTLVISGFVIGHVGNEGRIAIYDLNAADQNSPEVTGASRVRDLSLPKGGDGTMWKGTNFRFRAVDGTFKVVIWGSGIYLFAGGQGTVTLTGSTETPSSDGKFSLNGGAFVSVPVGAQKTIGTVTSAG